MPEPPLLVIAINLSSTPWRRRRRWRPRQIGAALDVVGLAGDQQGRGTVQQHDVAIGTERAGKNGVQRLRIGRGVAALQVGRVRRP